MLCFSVAYQSKVLTVPLDWLKAIMFYTSIRQLTTDLQYYGLTVDLNSNTIKFQRDLFQSAKPVVCNLLLFFRKFI